MTVETHNALCNHLIRDDGDEDLCFATYVKSIGVNRSTAIIKSIILPKPGERKVHGNAGFMPSYFKRAVNLARIKKEGLVFLHSHPSHGWQNMSSDDVIAEMRIAPTTMTLTDFPLLGLTLGTDGAWSARFWTKDNYEKRKYNRNWCETVRVVSHALKITYNDNLISPSFDRDKQLRTISAWGTKTQEDISRLRIGIVGLGSVGSIVVEILARTGITNFSLIDFDTVEEKNLDRITNIFKQDIGRAKVLAVADGIERSATSPNVNVICCEYSICEEEGFKRALDCDILFSCVDRPWPRQTMNYISYAHLIPVIDGGILVRTNKSNTKLIGADWKAQTVGYKRPCLKCLGQYKAVNAALESSGLLDDPSYIKGMDKSILAAHENVFAFSSHIASMEVLQMLSLFISPGDISNLGQQMYHLVNGEMSKGKTHKCHKNCDFKNIVGKGDKVEFVPYGDHLVAKRAREKRNKK